MRIMEMESYIRRLSQYSHTQTDTGSERVELQQMSFSRLNVYSVASTQLRVGQLATPSCWVKLLPILAHHAPGFVVAPHSYVPNKDCALEQTPTTRIPSAWNARHRL